MAKPSPRSPSRQTATQSSRAAPTGGARTLTATATLDAHRGGVTGAVWHSNGTQAVSAGADRTVKLWDLSMGKAVRAWGPLADPVAAVALSKDSALLGAATGKSV